VSRVSQDSCPKIVSRVSQDRLGVTPALPPSVHASRMEALHGLWTDAGLEGIETRAITVQRSFDSFDNFWQVTTATGGPRPTLELMECYRRIKGSGSRASPGRPPGADHIWRVRQRDTGPRAEAAVTVK
jgi:hypothetical protein